MAEAQIRNLLEDRFLMDVTHLKKLGGLDNANYLLQLGDTKYVLKIYPNTHESMSLVQAENEALLFMADKGVTSIQKPVPFGVGDYLPVVELDGSQYIFRLLTFLEGKFMLEVPQTPELYRSLGRVLAEMDRQLLQFDNYVYKSRKYKWDICNFELNRPYLQHIPDGKDRSLVKHFFLQYQQQVVPVIPQLRTSILYHDANEWNLLANDGEVTGVIDFGDMTHTLLINELAIAIAYGCYSKEDPLKWAPYIIEAYHKVLPLEELELKVLYYLVAGRLCITIANAAMARVEDPDNDYAFVSEEYAWSMLRKWIAINPLAAENCFRRAAHMPALEKAPVADMIKNRQEHLSPILSVSYKEPIHMIGAAKQYMYDARGNTFLDAYNNIPLVGHCHPKVVEAGQRQMARLNTNTRYLYGILDRYAESLLAKFPNQLNKIFFVNSGSAATDLALRMAQFHTQQKNIMVMEHGYHGNTMAAIDVSYYKFSHPRGIGKGDHIHIAPLPDTYRGKYTNDDGTAGKQYAQEAIKLIEQSSQPIGTFITETILGCAGQVPLAKDYLKHLFPAIRKQGGVCIVDEVQTGFGRIGSHYWSYELQDVVPDIVILGKPMGNGHPIGAVVCTEEIAASFERGPEFFSSFGGNPVSCAIGLAVLQTVEEEGLQQHSQEVGEYYNTLFQQLQSEHGCIGDVRGTGLFLGADIVNPGTKDPDTALASQIKNGLRDKHILISTDGPADNVIKTKPPLCFMKEDALRVVEEMDAILRT